MKRSQPRRDWRAAREKVEREDACRVCGSPGWLFLEAAHIIGREMDMRPHGNDWAFEAVGKVWVNPLRVVPLCKPCHRRYDPPSRGLDEEPLDLLPSLTDAEKRQAFEDCDFDAFAFLFRLTGRRFVPKEEEAA